MKIECKYCLFWVKNNTQPQQSAMQGQCRKKSPEIFKSPPGLYANNGTITLWPQTTEFDYCGEFKNK